MSSGVSQIEYWREVPKPDTAKSPNTKNITESGPGAIYLSYDVFLGLSVIGGFLALDHLYLRSPLTFLAKIIINILTLGTWWLYDASQAVFNRDVVKVFGLGVPGLGPKGIGAGVLASDVPDKKHMSFFIYGLALLFGGLFGLDSFIVGDKQSGITRIICLITGILAPIAIIWWLINIGKFFLKTKDVTNQYWEYFGAPEPLEHKLSFIEKLVQKFPFLEYIVSPIMKIKNAVVGVAEDAKDLGEATLIHPINTIESVATAPIRYAKNKLGEVVETAEKIVTGPVKAVASEIGSLSSELEPVIESALKPAELAAEAVLNPVVAAVAPLKDTLNTGLGVVEEGLETAKDGIELGKNALNKGTQLASNTLQMVGQTANAATKALTLVPAAAALSNGFTESAARTALDKLKQDGGSNTSGILPYVMMGTLAIIVVSGIVLTYRRFSQNGRPRKDDSPPEPGVLRKSNQEKSSDSTRSSNSH
jgi:hypothetical protein